MTNVLATAGSPEQKPAAINGAKQPAKSKPRKRVNTAEKRHQHNAIERQRRETLNGKFIHLARLLPSLASHRRPSKSAIVNGSIGHLNHQRNQRLLAAKLLRNLCAEHDALLTEVNEWRKANGFAPKEPTSAWTGEVDEVLSVEKESFGNFSMFEGEDGDDDEGDAPESVVDSNPSYVMTNGLITPRTSTDSAASFAQTHAVFGNMPVPEQRQAHPNNAINWSSEFAMSMGGGSLAFDSLLPRTNEQASVDSPENSQHGAGVTPPTYTDILHAGHTPSPRSSSASAFDEHSSAPPTAHGLNWAAMVPSQAQAQAQLLAQRNGSFASAFDPQGNSGHFTQQVMASMLGNVSQDNVEQWRRTALGAVLPEDVRSHPAHNATSVHDLRNAVRLGMGVGFRMQGNAWPTTAVEGF